MNIVKASHWIVKGRLEVGKRVIVQNREYTLLAAEPYTTKYGHPSELLNWEGRCVICHNKLRFKSPRSKFEPIATCKKHRGQA
jgi:hypothetical protein